MLDLVASDNVLLLLLLLLVLLLLLLLVLLPRLLLVGARGASMLDLVTSDNIVRDAVFVRRLNARRLLEEQF